VASKGKAKGLAPASAILAKNRRATFNFEVLERFEAGIVLSGSEVKSIRAGQISLAESYAAFDHDELFLQGAHIAEWVQAHARNHPPIRPRKLLLHRRELDKLLVAVQQEGLTVVPLAVYLKDGRIKVEIGLARGKKVHDKRAALKEREQTREMSRAIRERD
jgi:SsrA-binding protein